MVGNLVGNNWWSTQNHLGKFLGGRHTTFLVFVFVFVASCCGDIASLAGNNSGGIASRNSRPADELGASHKMKEEEIQISNIELLGWVADT